MTPTEARGRLAERGWLHFGGAPYMPMPRPWGWSLNEAHILYEAGRDENGPLLYAWGDRNLPDLVARIERMEASRG